MMFNIRAKSGVINLCVAVHRRARQFPLLIAMRIDVPLHLVPRLARLVDHRLGPALGLHVVGRAVEQLALVVVA